MYNPLNSENWLTFPNAVAMGTIIKYVLDPNCVI